MDMKHPLYCTVYCLVIFYNLPFFICEMNYALAYEKQACLDTDFGVGMSLRQWLFSSSMIGLSHFLFQLLVILWKILLPRYGTCSHVSTLINFFFFLVKFLGYNGFGFVLYGFVLYERSGEDG